MDETIVKVRKFVRYVRSSPQRQSTFKLCAEKEKVGFKSQLCLDVPTRWNYTYMMLERAEKYQKAFERLEEEDPNYLRTIREEAKEEGNDRHEQFFLFGAHDTINLEYEKDGYLLRKMVDYMKNKLERYWGNFDNMNHLWLVLDPQYKLRYLEYCFGTLYENQKATDMIERIKTILVDLYDAYTQNYMGSSSASAAAQAQGQKPSGSMERDDSSVVVDVKAMRMMGYKKHLKGIDSSNTKSEVDKYLLESCEDVLDEKFNVLAWWKVNSP
ncbi:zinc finger BED domain-containing protein RICESLEEPER 2-like [Castanea sativa]|uniref:zinc finger BED domain-containing protein RICESLEEPER 2-like n=1 Tax=Castanea sativa TaxID=21020 RepID=UPI003F64E968